MTDAIHEQTEAGEKSSRAERDALDQLASVQAEAAEREAEARLQAAFIAERAAEDLSDAIEQATAAQRENLANAWVLQSDAQTRRSRELFDAGLFEDALAQVSRAIELDRGNLAAHSVASAALEHLGRVSEASKSRETQARLLRTSTYKTVLWIKYVLAGAAPKSDHERDVVFATQQDAIGGTPDEWLELIGDVERRGYRSEARALWRDISRKACSMPMVSVGFALGYTHEAEDVFAKHLGTLDADSRDTLLARCRSIDDDSRVPASCKATMKKQLTDKYKAWNVIEKYGPARHVPFVPVFDGIFVFSVAGLLAMYSFGVRLSLIGLAALVAALWTFFLWFKGSAAVRDADAAHAKSMDAFVSAECSCWRGLVDVAELVPESQSHHDAFKGRLWSGAIVGGMLTTTAVVLLVGQALARTAVSAPTAVSQPSAEPSRTSRQASSPPRKSVSARARPTAANRSASTTTTIPTSQAKPAEAVAAIRDTRAVVARAPRPEPESSSGSSVQTAGATSTETSAIASREKTKAQRVRAGGTIKMPEKLKDVRPVHPPEAARIQGIVLIEAVVGVGGKVISAHILRSIPLLDQAALDAVRQWEYAPTVWNGAPVEVVFTTAVQFTVGGV